MNFCFAAAIQNSVKKLPQLCGKVYTEMQTENQITDKLQ